jgi:hypothetical protein
LQFKKLHISLLLIGLISSPLFSRDFTIREIKVEYDKFLHIRLSEYGESFEVDSLPADHFLATFVNGNYYYVLYLLDNCSEKFHPTIKGIKQKGRIENKWRQFFQNNSLFDSNFLNAVAYYMLSKGDKIVDYEVTQKKSHSQKEVLRAGSFFFYPHYIESYKRFGTHVCVGINGLNLSGQPVSRDYLFEAFCYAAIFPQTDMGESSLMNSYGKIFNSSLSSELPVDIKSKEKALQRKVWKKLQQCPELKDVLQKKYESMKSILPFSIQFS